MYTLARTTRAASYAEMRREEAVMAADTVITYILFGLPPRRVRREFPESTPEWFILANAPKGAFAYLRNGVTHYIDAPIIQRVQLNALIAMIGDIIANNKISTVTNADKLDDTDVKLGAELYRQELKRRLPVTTAAMGF